VERLEQAVKAARTEECEQKSGAKVEKTE